MFARELRQSFDEVFAALVARDQATSGRSGRSADRSVRTTTRATVPIPTPIRCRPRRPRHEGARDDDPAPAGARRKELVEVIRRPGALVSLVFGPFLIMAVFGLGYNGERRPLETVVVIPPQSGLPSDAGGLPGPRGRRAAHQRGRPGRGHRGGRAWPSGTTDVVVVAPPDAEAQFRAGKQSVIEVVVDTVDPLRANYAGFLAANLANGVNQAIIRQAVGEGQEVRDRRGRAERGQDPARGGRRADPRRAAQQRPVRAARDGLLRAGGPRAHPPAPRGHARRARPRAGADERRDRGLPRRPGQRLGGDGRQDHRLPADRRVHRGDHAVPSSSA